jgi:hypothetical protein
VGFALIGFTAALATAASGPAHATVAAEASETLPVFFGPLPPKTIVAFNDTASYTPPTAHENEGKGVFEPATVSCTPNSPVTLGMTPTPVTCTAIDPTDPTVTNWNTYQFNVVDGPTLPRIPSPQTFTADGTDTAANVTYTNPTTGASEAVTASEDPYRDEVGETVPSCFPLPPPPPSGQLPATSNDEFRSGGTFPLGVTKLYCTAPDYTDGQPGRTPPSAILSVTVADQPATLTVPPLQLARATSSSGATVTYAPDPVMATEIGATATEADTPLCSTDKAASSADGFISGGTFPVGGTTVTCAAPVNDDPTNPGPYQAFTVIITNTPCAALAGCNLHGLDLSNAILAGADLSSGTDLSNANLNKADLSGANLSFANLSGANLNEVDLTGANLTGAITTGANFNKVTWSNTTCPDGTNSSASTPETCVGHL